MFHCRQVNRSWKKIACLLSCEINNISVRSLTVLPINYDKTDGKKLLQSVPFQFKIQNPSILTRSYSENAEPKPETEKVVAEATPAVETKAAPAAEADVPPPVEEAAAEPPPQENKKMKIYLKGLPYSVIQNDIRHFFGDLEIFDIDIKEFPNRPGFKTGTAEIEINSEDKEKFLEKNKQYIGSRFIEVYESSDVKANQGGSVLLRGMPFTANEQDVINFLEGIKISKVQFLIDMSGRPNGHAIVTLEDLSQKGECFKFDRKYMGSRYVDVLEPMEQARRNTSMQRNTSQDFLSGPLILNLRGLPYWVTERDLAKFFGNIPLKQVVFHHNSRGLKSGNASVELAEESDINAALDKNCNYIGERYVEVKMSSNDMFY